MPKSRQRKNRRILIPGSISKLALLGALLGAGGAATANANASTQQAITQQAQTPKEQPKKVTRKADTMAVRRIAFGGKDLKGSGMRPKEYGQFLQRAGRQKWNKRSLK